MNKQACVYIIDDDPSTRESLSAVAQTAGFPAESYGSAEAFLNAYQPTWPGCLVIDVRMDGMNGLELQHELSTRGIQAPAIMITGHADLPTVVKSVKAGAFDFVEKPIEPNDLVDLVRRAIDHDRENRTTDSQRSTRLAGLSSRQREVMHMLLDGKGTKEIARDLGISPKTVEKHRANVLVKMHAESVVDLMRQMLAPKNIAS
jgi:two-component system response regulator DctR